MQLEYAIKSGDVDCIMANLNVTSERKESVLFTVPYFKGGTVLAVLKEDSTAGTGFLSSIADSFNKTFIRESRWKMFVTGVINTLIITVLAIISGTALGFAVFYACRGGNVFANTMCWSGL